MISVFEFQTEDNDQVLIDTIAKVIAKHLNVELDDEHLAEAEQICHVYRKKYSELLWKEETVGFEQTYYICLNYAWNSLDGEKFIEGKHHDKVIEVIDRMYVLLISTR